MYISDIVPCFLGFESVTTLNVNYLLVFIQSHSKFTIAVITQMVYKMMYKKKFTLLFI